MAEENQDIMITTRILGEGTIWISNISKGNLTLFPAQLLACRLKLSCKCPPCINLSLLRYSKWHRKDSKEAAHHHQTGA